MVYSDLLKHFNGTGEEGICSGEKDGTKIIPEGNEQIEYEIEKIRKRFEILIQESVDVFEILDKDGTIKYISKASEKVIGYKPEERLGKKYMIFMKDRS